MASSNVSASSLFSVSGLVAVVTGGGTGIGFMITKALAANGARRVYIIGRRQDKLEEAANAIDPNVVSPLQGDVTDLESLLEISQTVESSIGYVNLVVANAGTMGPRPLKPPPGSTTLPSLAEYREHALKAPMQDFTQTCAVNTTAVHYTALAFLNLLDEGNKKQNMGADWRSQIIATGSIGGFSRLSGASFAYNSSKAAVTHMMKMMSTAFVPYGIRCNVLAPGVFPSDITNGIFTGQGDARGEIKRFPREMIPAGRAGTEEDIAGAILWMVGRAGSYLNGSVVVVDGGRLGTLISTY
ncbi:unnamed protein product [Periconia digitata]|uniref:NAD(P)-binding protein n=1 Tax=Periconia digitata TaxID=1303443 RepID=A0A9W4UCZ4_9PLEO|nr:unnamed protein product [Periconia digitata]